MVRAVLKTYIAGFLRECFNAASNVVDWVAVFVACPLDQPGHKWHSGLSLFWTLLELLYYSCLQTSGVVLPAHEPSPGRVCACSETTDGCCLRQRLHA